MLQCYRFLLAKEADASTEGVCRTQAHCKRLPPADAPWRCVGRGCIYLCVCAKPSDEAAGSDVLGFVRIKEHWAFVKRRDEIRELHIWQGQHDCKAG